MGCFLGCFGDAKDRKSKKQRPRRASPKGQFLQKRNQVENDQQQSILVVDQSIRETPPTNLVSELQDNPKDEEKLSPILKKRVTFNSNITTHDHVSVFESTDSLPECNISVQKEKEKDLKGLNPSNSGSEDGNSVTSSVGSYPSNHRYHHAIDSEDEAEDYGDSDLDDLDDFDDEQDFTDCDEDDVDCVMNCQDVWSESILISSAESRVENHSGNSVDEEVESRMLETRQPNEENEAFESKTNARDRRDYVNSMLNPVENITQWKTIKSKGASHLSKPQKENLVSHAELMSKQQLSLGLGTKSDELKRSNQEMAVDASLSNWLVSPEITPSKNSFSSHLESVTSGNTISKGSHSVRSFEDRPILGALTVDELKQISLSSSPKKTSPIRNPDEMPIIGSVGTYWNHSGSAKNFDLTASYKGIPNTTSKYREDKVVHWQSTPFETRLERALNQGSTRA